MSSPNILFLDEPTNDLDINTLVALEDYLDDFGGALIVVTHDRYFLDRIVENIFRFNGDGSINEYPGNYSAYLERIELENSNRKEAEKLSETVETKSNRKSGQDKQRKLSYKEKQEFEKLEKTIAKAENRLVEIDGQ